MFQKIDYFTQKTVPQIGWCYNNKYVTGLADL